MLMIFVHKDLSNNKLMISVVENFSFNSPKYQNNENLNKLLKTTESGLNMKSSNVPLEQTDNWDDYSKIQILWHSDKLFSVVFAHCGNKFIDIFIIEQDEETPGIVNWVVQKNRFVNINETFLGISKFSFNDYYAAVLANEIEIMMVQDSSVLFVRVCMIDGSIIEFFEVNNLEHMSLLQKVECFYQKNDSFSPEVMYLSTECIVTTEGSYVYSFRTMREVSW